ncbi:synaptotagmin-like protein 5 [Pollicipes pollicipes]|uniref:synaptotagmin-like protein 5 n=1 Tax=Pollicipes pollicipes TaxID=41117 RepID=UPI0018849373|nr:synaptotagmin-like protein 5 [Pollicipes pollicipes]
MSGDAAQMNMPEVQLTPEEIQKIMDVIKRDDAIRREESVRIRRLKAELQQLRRKGALRAGTDRGRSCARCLAELGRIMNRGAPCRSCQMRVCKSCREFSNGGHGWVCTVCNKRIEIQLATGQWMDAFVRRPSRRRESVAVPTSVLRRQIRRSWTISNAAESGRSVADMRARQARQWLAGAPPRLVVPRKPHDWDSLSSEPSSGTSSPLVQRHPDRAQHRRRSDGVGNGLRGETPVLGLARSSARPRGGRAATLRRVVPADTVTWSEAPLASSSPPPATEPQYENVPSAARPGPDGADASPDRGSTSGWEALRREEERCGGGETAEKPGKRPHSLGGSGARQTLTAPFRLEDGRRGSCPTEEADDPGQGDPPRRSSDPSAGVDARHLAALRWKLGRPQGKSDLRRLIEERRRASLLSALSDSAGLSSEEPARGTGVSRAQHQRIKCGPGPDQDRLGP